MARGGRDWTYLDRAAEAVGTGVTVPMEWFSRAYKNVPPPVRSRNRAMETITSVVSTTSMSRKNI